MNDRPDKATPQHGARTTIKLLSPITRGVPSPVTEITVREPLLSDRVEMERKYARNVTKASIWLIARLTGLPEDTAGALKVRDSRRIQSWTQTLNKPVDVDAWTDDELASAAEMLGLAGDGTDVETADLVRDDLIALLEPHRDDLAAIGPARDVDMSTPRTFRLVVPVPLDEGEIGEITLDEPDLETAVVSGQFKTEGEQLAAMIAHLAGLTIPIAMRLTLRDVREMESYIGAFTNAPVESEPAPVKTTRKSPARKARTAGET